MLWVKDSVRCLQLHVYICSAGKLRAWVSRTAFVALFCKDNTHLPLKIKILIRRAFTVMPQVLLAPALCLICLCHTELMNPTTICIKEPHLFWHLMSKNSFWRLNHLSHRWHKLLPEHLVLSMSDKTIQHLVFLGLSTEMYHTISFKANQHSTKRDSSHFVLHSQA